MRQVLVTGANKGIGYEIARHLGKSGWQVIVGARNESRAKAAVESLRKDGADIIGWQYVNLSDNKEIENSAKAIAEAYPILSLLVNNAGIPGDMAVRSFEQAILAVVFGYLYPADGVRTVRAVHQGTYQFILVGQEPREQLLARHLVDTAASLVPHYCLVGFVEVGGTKDYFQQVFLVEWYFHDVDFAHPHEGLHSLIPFGFRPVSLRAVISIG